VGHQEKELNSYLGFLISGVFRLSRDMARVPFSIYHRITSTPVQSHSVIHKHFPAVTGLFEHPPLKMTKKCQMN
jgi:hypothetical protein